MKIIVLPGQDDSPKEDTPITAYQVNSTIASYLLFSPSPEKRKTFIKLSLPQFLPVVMRIPLDNLKTCLQGHEIKLLR